MSEALARVIMGSRQDGAQPGEREVGGMTTHISKDGVCVDQDYFWRPMHTCQRSVKVQLLGHGGLPAYSHYDGKDNFWIAWAPLPKKPKWMTGNSGLKA